ncbi:MAG TPA: DNA adenine methylase [Gemmatimonadaceae bacterium]|nr:DNA adenine methylase [Gemmatimonadaceae bacterium]
MIKYLGSKRRLVARIVALVRAIPRDRDRLRVLDLFTGTTRVAQGLKAAGFDVTANDIATYSEVLATAYIAVDGDAAGMAALQPVLDHLNALPGRRAFFTRTFCEDARYFQPKNGMRIDAIRAEIDEVARDGAERAVLLTALLEAADRVDSTTGLQMAYLKQWAPRSHRDLRLRAPALLPGDGRAVREDALAFVERAERFDVAYLDPPYNQHSYFSNYHVWETLVRDDAPDVYGVAMKRADCRTEKSVFNRRGQAWDAMRACVLAVRARHVLLSFSNEGFFTGEAIRALLLERFAEVAVVPVPSRRYVGAQIGIHNRRGERVGQVSHLDNTELLFLAGPDAHGIAARASAESLAPPLHGAEAEPVPAPRVFEP